MKFNALIQETPEVTVPVLEAIAFQRDDKFGQRLEALISEYKEMVDSGASQRHIEGNVELKKRFEKAIFDRLGVTVTLICDKEAAACIPNVYASHSGMVRDAARASLDSLSSQSGIALLRGRDSGDSLGTVSTSKAKITGWLSEQVVPLYMNWVVLFTEMKVTIAEAVAIVLHELGHIFDSAALAFTVNQSNLVITDVVKYISGGRADDTEYVYKELSKIDAGLTKDTVEGLQSGNAVVYGVSAFRLLVGSINNLSGSRVYNRTSSEAMADSFAVKFNYGEHLVTGLDKMLNDPMRQMTQSAMSVLVAALYILLLYRLYTLLAVFGIVMKTATFTSVFGYLFALGQMLVPTITLTITNRVTTADYEYDKDADRIRRISQDMIGSLKDPTISKATKRDILDQLKLVDTIKARTHNVPNILQNLLKLFFASDRRSSRSITTQQQIETVLANQLFRTAAELDTKE